MFLSLFLILKMKCNSVQESTFYPLLKTDTLRIKNAEYGQQSTLSHMYEIQSKTVNRVKNSPIQLKLSKLVKNG